MYVGEGADIRQTSAVREISCELRSIGKTYFCAPQHAEIVSVAGTQVRCTCGRPVAPSR